MKEKDFSSKNNKRSAGNWEVRDADSYEQQNFSTDSQPEQNHNESDEQPQRKKRERIDFGSQRDSSYRNRDYSARQSRNYSDSNRSRGGGRDGDDNDSYRKKRYDNGGSGDFERKKRYDSGGSGDFERKKRYDNGGNGDFERKKRYDNGGGGDFERKKRYDNGGSGDFQRKNRYEGGDRPRRTYSDSNDRRPERRDYDRDRFSNNRSGDRFEKPRRRYSDSNDSGDERRYPDKERFSTERRSGSSFRRNDSPWRRDDRADRPRKYSDKPEKRRHEPRKMNPDDLVRLNKFIANSGVCSRREADEYITAGLVTVNEIVVTELGTKIKQSDDVRFNGERLKGEKKVYVLLNKPKNYVTTVEDPHAKQTVMDLVEGACPERIYPVGRLDKNSTGVLLLTNDGELTKQLTHPSYNKMKIYKIKIDKNITKNDLQQQRDGVELEDGLTLVDDIQVLEDDKSELGIEIHSGKNRIIRRMFERLGYEVLRLDRVYFAGLTKKGLQRGEYRLLSPREVEILKMGAYD